MESSSSPPSSPSDGGGGSDDELDAGGRFALPGVALVAQCRLAGVHVIKEWIEFHRLLGVSRFYIWLRLDEGDTDGRREVRCRDAGAAAAYRSDEAEADAAAAAALAQCGAVRQLLQCYVDSRTVRLIPARRQDVDGLGDDDLVCALAMGVRDWARTDDVRWLVGVGDVTTFLLPRSALPEGLTSCLTSAVTHHLPAFSIPKIVGPRYAGDCKGDDEKNKNNVEKEEEEEEDEEGDETPGENDCDGEKGWEDARKEGDAIIAALQLEGATRETLHAGGPASCFVEHVRMGSRGQSTPHGNEPVRAWRVGPVASGGAAVVERLCACRCPPGGDPDDGARGTGPIHLLERAPVMAARLRERLTPRLAVCMHVGYASEWPYYACHLANVPEPYDLYVTVVRDQLETPYGIAMMAALRAIDGVHPTGVSGAATFLLPVENRGMDPAGWLRAVEAMQAAGRRDRAYGLLLKLHTKSALNLGPHWRRALLDPILGSRQRARACIARVLARPSSAVADANAPRLPEGAPEAGLAASADWLLVEPPRPAIAWAGGLLGLPDEWFHRPVVFVGGTMFWARAQALLRLFCPDVRRQLGWPPVAFGDVIAAMPDGRDLTRGEGLPHFMERVFGVAVVNGAGLAVVGLREEALLRDAPRTPHTEVACTPAEYARHVDHAGGAHSAPSCAPGVPFPLTGTDIDAADPRPPHLVPCEHTGCVPAALSAAARGARRGEDDGAIDDVAPDRRGIGVTAAAEAPSEDGSPPAPEGESSPAVRAEVARHRERMAAEAVGARVAIEAAYRRESGRSSDINEHLPALRALARRCAHVTVCGLGSDAATWAILAGLVAGIGDRAPDGPSPAAPAGARPNATASRYLGIDAEWHDGLRAGLATARRAGLRAECRVTDGADTDIEPTDMLFIDSWHVAGHLLRELRAHASRVRRWIVLHDTTIDAYVGESVRMGHDIAREMAESGLAEGDIRNGLWPAVELFLGASAGRWRLRERRANNNGLTVIERVHGDDDDRNAIQG